MNILCMGDSITFGQHLPIGTPAWPERMGAMGRGVCGETTRQALERFPRDVQEHPADVVVLQWGHNDANRWQTDHGLPRVSAEAYSANLVEMVARCRAVGSRPVLCTITPTLKGEDYERDVVHYDVRVRFVARTLNVPLADVRQEFLERDLSEALLDDGMHLSDHGHDLYGDIVMTAVGHRLVLA